ncbi:MAG: MOSC domain-containing protein [Thiobacillaceae bacterium]|nr:MOSC domain-containing protein [Thiobacillaceae bacterium]
MSAWAPVRISMPMIGHTRPFGPNGEPSAIDKHPVAQPVWLGPAGLAGDEHGDTVHHGGTDKALHHYAREHYAVWHRDLPQLPAQRWQAGGFGENISTLGLTEGGVCIGDIVRLGTTVLQVSQPRQPCWKLNLRFGCADMARRVQASARTGWYYRVLEAGEVAPGDELRLIDRPHGQWPLSRLLHHFYIEPLDRDALAAIAALEVLAPSWRQTAAQRLMTGRVEDWSRRLDTPVAAND